MVTLFSVEHLSILACVVIAGVGLGCAVRRGAVSQLSFGILGISIAVSELAWYSFALASPWPVWPGSLPLHLCDVTLWLTVVSAIARSQRAFDIVFYWGFAGTTMALLTPDIQGLRWSYPVAQFFLSHGLVIVTLLALAISRTLRPSPRSAFRAFGWLQVYALAVGSFNMITGSNYMYLREKPMSFTLLDFLGPWPAYILVCEVIAAIFFLLLFLPFRTGSTRDRPADAGRLA